MQVAEIMKRQPWWCRPEQTFAEAARLMRDENIGFLPLCAEDRRLKGVCTDRDLVVRGLAEGLGGATPLDRVMSTELVTCSQDDDLEDCARFMSERRISRLCVVDDAGKLCGVVSLSDLAQALGRESADVLQAITQREASAPI